MVLSPADENGAILTHEDTCPPNQPHDPGQTNSALLASVSPSTSSPGLVLNQTLLHALPLTMQMSLTDPGRLEGETPRERQTPGQTGEMFYVLAWLDISTRVIQSDTNLGVAVMEFCRYG